MAKRTCDRPGCDKPHRARGLCATHYNQTHLPDRHKTTITCAECGKGHVTTRTNSMYCSLHCRDMARIRSTLARQEAAPPRRPTDRRGPLRRAIEDGPAEATLQAIQARTALTDDGCWEWTGPTDRHGYPTYRWRESGRTRERPVHRLSLEAALGRPLGSQPAHHICANTSCVNPQHLQPVTHKDNAAEMLARTYMLKRIAELEDALAEVEPQHPLLAVVKTPRLDPTLTIP